MPSSSTAARLFRPDVSRLPVNLSQRTCTTVDCRLLLLPKNSCTWTEPRQQRCRTSIHLIVYHFSALKCTEKYKIQQCILLLMIRTKSEAPFFCCLPWSRMNRKWCRSNKESLTISSRHCIVPRDASTISSDRLSTRVWAFVLIKDETL